MFQHGPVRMWVKRQKIPMPRFRGHFLLEDLSEFCEQMEHIAAAHSKKQLYNEFTWFQELLGRIASIRCLSTSMLSLCNIGEMSTTRIEMARWSKDSISLQHKLELKQTRFGYQGLLNGGQNLSEENVQAMLRYSKYSPPRTKPIELGSFKSILTRATDGSDEYVVPQQPTQQMPADELLDQNSWQPSAFFALTAASYAAKAAVRFVASTTVNIPHNIKYLLYEVLIVYNLVIKNNN